MLPAKPAKVAPAAGAKKVVLRCDGASRGNPGPAAGAYLLLDEHDRELAAEGKYLGNTTNNEAEYRALIAGLERASAMQVQRLDVRMDSELVVLQLKGRYRVRAANLAPLYERARSLLAKFPEATVRHVPRGENSRADALANTALDAAKNTRRADTSSRHTA
ncbi:MAG: ribonuclease HI family protein [Chloroflexota bacterium]